MLNVCERDSTLFKRSRFEAAASHPQSFRHPAYLMYPHRAVSQLKREQLES